MLNASWSLLATLELLRLAVLFGGTKVTRRFLAASPDRHSQ